MASLTTPIRLASFHLRSSSFARTSCQLQTRSSQSRCSSFTSYNNKNLPVWRSGRSRLSLGFSSARLATPAPSKHRAVTGIAANTNQMLEKSEHLPPYKSPTTGLISKLPARLIPYAELIRLDKPAGTYYLFLPCLFSTMLAAPIADVPPSTVLATSALFFSGALIMRGAGCTVNDLWDRNLDPHVARTRLRPIARGAISVQQAIPYLGIQLLCGLGILLQFPFQCLYYGIPSLILVASYPLAKRVTNYPQFVLGLTFSWGAFMGFPALGVDLMNNTAALISAACLYSSCVAWTMVYDMIYAYQDIKDDVKAGIKSVALAHESNAKAFLSFMSLLQVSLLAGAGLAIGAGPLFHVGACGGAAATLGYMIVKVDLSNVKDCWTWFRRGAWFTGGAISIGLLGEYLAQYYDLYGKEKKRQVIES